MSTQSDELPADSLRENSKLLQGFVGNKISNQEHSPSKVIINAGPESHAEEENINIRAAVVHVVGDMLQSIGVIIASIIIKYDPSASIADPICTYLFSILVIVTTIPVFKDCLRVLMESSPQEVNVLEMKSKI